MNRMVAIAAWWGCVAFAPLVAVAPADERLEGIACRSVHLQYSAPPGRAFYNEVKVERTASGTYFCVCGFLHGYYGMQELASGNSAFAGVPEALAAATGGEARFSFATIADADHMYSSTHAALAEEVLRWLGAPR